jgi:prepilin-type N-terminal cleavage/methylation domain-containing protein
VRGRSKGFTLLELLIAMSLMALLMGVLVIGVHISIRAWQQGEARLRETHKEEERTTFLERQISSLVPYAVISPDPDLPGRLSILEATASRLRFLSNYGSQFQNRSGLLLAEYGVLETSPGKVALNLRETPMADDQILLRQLIERVVRDPDTGNSRIRFQPFSTLEGNLKLIVDLDEARFEYLDPDPERGGKAWFPEWIGRPDAPYPSAIRLLWRRGTRLETELIPLRAHSLPK